MPINDTYHYYHSNNQEDLGEYPVFTKLWLSLSVTWEASCLKYRSLGPGPCISGSGLRPSIFPSFRVPRWFVEMAGLHQPPIHFFFAFQRYRGLNLHWLLETPSQVRARLSLTSSLTESTLAAALVLITGSLASGSHGLFT